MILFSLGRQSTPDLSHAQANISAAGTRASAYFSSWGTWASEKRKGWTSPKTPLSSPTPVDGRREQEFTLQKERIVGSCMSEGEGNGKQVDDATVVPEKSLVWDAEKDAAASTTVAQE